MLQFLFFQTATYTLFSLWLVCFSLLKAVGGINTKTKFLRVGDINIPAPARIHEYQHRKIEKKKEAQSGGSRAKETRPQCDSRRDELLCRRGRKSFLLRMRSFTLSSVEIIRHSWFLIGFPVCSLCSFIFKWSDMYEGWRRQKRRGGGGYNKNRKKFLSGSVWCQWETSH